MTQPPPAVPNAERLLACIARAQRDFIMGGEPRPVFRRLLDDVIGLTDSEYGFIGEVLHDEEDRPFLRTWAISNIAWTDDLRAFYDENEPRGIEFRNLDTLFGAVLVTGEAIATDHPADHPAAGGVPAGHPPLNAFLGIPMRVEGRMVGMLGLANRPGGYGAEMGDYLAPFGDTCAGLIASLRAQAAREAAERAVSGQEARFRAVLEASADAILIMDDRGIVEDVNPSVERIFGFRPEEIVGGDLGRILSETSASRCRATLEEYARDGGSDGLGRRFECEGRRRDDTAVPVEFLLTEVRADGRRLLSATCRDLSDRRRAEEQVRRAARIVDATTDLVAVADPEGRILELNAAGRSMLALPPGGEFPHMGQLAVIAPEAREAFEQECLPVVLTGRVWSGETVLVDGNGRRVPVSQVVIPHVGPAGGIEYYSSICRDISDRRELERVKNEFVSTVSHELRTPLSSIRGSLGLLAAGVMGELPEEAGRLVELAATNTDRLVRLINDLLDLERMAARRFELQTAPVDAAELARIAVGNVAGAAAEVGVDVALIVRDEGAIVDADADRLVQVLVNLLGNAIKFSPEGGEVLLEFAGGDDGGVIFRVTDRGIGIAPDAVEVIFEPFRQLDASDTRAAPGSGLGLTIARSIVEAHGGSIRVQSEPGVGSSFEVRIPPAGTTPPAPTTADREILSS